MLGGAVLNASTFIGGSYLAKYLSGTKTDQNGGDMISSGEISEGLRQISGKSAKVTRLAGTKQT